MKNTASVPAGSLLAATDILNHLEIWQGSLAAEKTDLFEQFEIKQLTKQKASSRKSEEQ